MKRCLFLVFQSPGPPAQPSPASKIPSAAAVMYSQAMSAVRSDTKQTLPPPVITKATLSPSSVPSSRGKIPGYLTAAEEKAALRRYENAKRAVDRVQNSGIFQDTPGGSGSGLISYDSLYPAPPSSSAAQSMGPPPPFEAGPPLTAPQQLSEKERLRRAYEAQDVASLSRQTSATVTPPQQGSPAPPPLPALYDESPPPPQFGGNSAYPSAAAEKEMLRRRFEGQDVVPNGIPSPIPPQTPPRNGSITSTLRSRPTPLPPPSADGNGLRVLTAAEEKALLKAKYETLGDGGEAPPPMYLNGYPSGLPSAGSSSGASHSALSYVSSMQMASPPPLMPRPPQEYIKETQEEDARLARIAMNGVHMLPGDAQNEEKTEVGHGTMSRKPTVTPVIVPFDKPPLPPKPLDE